MDIINGNAPGGINVASLPHRLAIKARYHKLVGKFLKPGGNMNHAENTNALMILSWSYEKLPVELRKQFKEMGARVAFKNSRIGWSGIIPNEDDDLLRAGETVDHALARMAFYVWEAERNGMKGFMDYVVRGKGCAVASSRGSRGGSTRYSIATRR